jgi:hypothetical protein
MNDIIYYHINITHKDKELQKLKELQLDSYFILGVELTDNDISGLAHINIDPQHMWNSKITAIEYSFNKQENILGILKPFDKIAMITIKSDIDSIGSMSVLTMLLQGEFVLEGDLILRLKAIAKSDRHGRDNWKTRREDFFNFKGHNTYGLPVGLLYMCSDLRLDINKKVMRMTQYLKTGIFDGIEKYTKIALINLDDQIKNAKIDIIIPDKLSVVKSNRRGAIAFGYKVSPVVIAVNEQFKFGLKKNFIVGTKMTIAQYTDNKFIDMAKIQQELSQLEQGWDGSSSIIGSPLDRPTKLDVNTIIDIVKKYLY